MSPVNPAVETETLHIRQALTADAARAPIGTPTWTGLNYPTGAKEARRLNPWVYATLAAAAAITIGGIALTRINHQPEDQATGFAPRGTEYPLVDLGEPSGGARGITVAALSRATQLPAAIVSGPSVLYGSGRAPMVMWCGLMAVGSMEVPDGGASGNGTCLGIDEVPQPLLMAVQAADGHDLTMNIWAWVNVPSDATVVSYADGDQQLWQRPIHRVVQFPDVVGDDEQVTAYDSMGNILATVDWPGVPQPQTDQSDEEIALFDGNQGELLSRSTYDQFRNCLVVAGASVSSDGSVAALPEHVDDQKTFDRCADMAIASVTAEVARLQPKFIPVTSEPALSTRTVEGTGDTVPAISAG